jgi:hypothetical protein
LYGLAPGDGPTKYAVARHDPATARIEGLFERVSDASWRLIDGDSLILGPMLTPFELRSAA